MMNITKKRYFFPMLFFICLSVMFLRRPDTLLYANFWAEDGARWYQQLYTFGAVSLFYPQDSYFQTISRITMILTLPFGIINAPLVSNLFSYILRTLPVLFLFSSRFPFIPLPYKFLATGYYLLMPNVDEVWGNITNVHWYLAMYLIMVIVAEEKNTLSSKIHDYSVLIVSGLSGPFIIFIMPIFVKVVY